MKQILLFVLAACTFAGADTVLTTTDPPEPPYTWKSAVCELGKSDLNVHVSNGSNTATFLDVRLRNFKSLAENRDLIIRLEDPSVGSVNFRDVFGSQWTLAESSPVARLESRCRIEFVQSAEVAGHYRIGVSCQNLERKDRRGQSGRHGFSLNSPIFCQIISKQ